MHEKVVRSKYLLYNNKNFEMKSFAIAALAATSAYAAKSGRAMVGTNIGGW